jgi:hypothetical protein
LSVYLVEHQYKVINPIISQKPYLPFVDSPFSSLNTRMFVTTLVVLTILLFFVSNEAFVSPGGGNSIHPRASSTADTTTSTSSTSLQMGLLNRFRKKKEAIAVNPIREGQPLPDIDVEVVVNAISMGNEEVTTATIPEVVGGPGINLLIGMPGAYTPKCSEEHMPGYIKASDKLKKLGVNNIAVVTTNGQYKQRESENFADALFIA